MVRILSKFLPIGTVVLVLGAMLLDGSSPARANPISGIGSVAVGALYGCALTDDRDVLCWGLNEYGQLGNGTVDSRLTPTLVEGLNEDIAAIAVADSIVGNYSCALTVVGSVKCWGSNLNGALGVDQSLVCTHDPIKLTHDASAASGFDIPCTTNPIDVPGLQAEATSISTGPTRACAVLNDTGVKCWGETSAAQRRSGTTSWISGPDDVCVSHDELGQCTERLQGIKEVAVAHDHTCALTTDGHVKCWGLNSRGQLGARSSDTCTGANEPCSVVPIEVCESYSEEGVCEGALSDVVAIAAESLLSCAVTSIGALKCWGSGALGGPARDTCYRPQTNDPVGCNQTPVTVTGLGSGVRSVDIGSYHKACAVLAEGSVKCWGSNFRGQLGDGTEENRQTPVDVCQTYEAAAEQCSQSLSGVSQGAVGSFHTCAVIEGGGVKCWGANSIGQLGTGIGDDDPHPLPVDVLWNRGKGTGDADCDGEVSSLDALAVLRYEAWLDRSIVCPIAADANEDGSIDATDALMMLQITAGLRH